VIDIRKLAQAILPVPFFIVACFISTWLTPAFGHSLPDSKLTFTKSEQQLNLSISFPLEDLLLASPDLSEINQVTVGSALSLQLQDQLESYIIAHLRLQQSNTDLPITFVSASVESAENEHVGLYKLLLSHLTLPGVVDGNVFPLTLSYDAVMHEIRNHRATVFWESSTSGKIVLAEFGFKRLNGKPKPVLLMKP